MIDATHPYPVEWIDRWQLANGKAVTVRPVLPQDQSMEYEFVASGLTSQSRYQRFQIGLRELPPSVARYFTHVDYHDHFALIVESFEDLGHIQVGDARFVRDGANAHSAEFGIAVADAWQGLGLGRRLLQTTIAAARVHGITHLYGDVLRENMAMLVLVKAHGFVARHHLDDGRLVRVQRTLDQLPDVVMPLAGMQQPVSSMETVRLAAAAMTDG